MKFNIHGIDESLQKAVKNISYAWNPVFADDGEEVVANRIERGFSVKRENGKVLIGFAKTTDFLRGLLYAASGIETKQASSFDELGMMVDCSRNAVLNTETVKKLVANLASMGYTYLYLYTEDTYEVENNPYFGYLRGRYTKEEIADIDLFCRELGMELIPCIQTLAHLNQITRYHDYCDIIDCNDILLCDDEKTYRLIDDMFTTLEHNFTSRKVNIGMDEAHFLGLGKYLDIHGYVSKFDIMFRHLQRVLEIAKKHGFTVCAMWSDMFFRMASGGEYYKSFETVPESLLGKIPQDVSLIYWDYYSTDYRHYSDMLKSHFMLSERIEFAGGAWKWVGWTPINEFSIKATEAAVRACKDCGIKNYFLTAWGDGGGEASVFSVLPSLYYLAQSAYGDDKNKEVFKTLTGVAFDDFMKIDLPNRANDGERTQRNNSSQFFLFDDLLFGMFDSLITKDQTKYYSRFIKVLHNVKAGAYGYIFDELSALCSVLKCKIDLAVRLKEAYAAKDKEKLKSLDGQFKNLLKKIGDFYKKFETAWYKENKSFGFEVQDQRFGGLTGRIRAVQKRVREYAEGKIENIPELDEKHLPYGCYGKETEFDNLFFVNWRQNVTVSNI